MFPLILTSDIYSINSLILILKILSQQDIKHIMMLQINNNIFGFEGLNTHYY